MTEKYSKGKGHESESHEEYNGSQDVESALVNEESSWVYSESGLANESSEHMEESEAITMPKVSYGTTSKVSVGHMVVKETKKTHKQSYVAPKPAPKVMHNACPPIVCDPQYIIRDCYVPREVPVIHPVVHVNRRIIVNVPKHYYQPSTKNVVIDPGCPR